MTVIGELTRSRGNSIDLAIRGKELKLLDITQRLGMEPTYGFEAGDIPHLRKDGQSFLPVPREAPVGVWHFLTTRELKYGELEEHGLFLVAKLEHAREAINQLIADPDYFVKISIWCSGYTFEMSGQTLAKLSAFAEYVAVTCWDEEEM